MRSMGARPALTVVAVFGVLAAASAASESHIVVRETFGRSVRDVPLRAVNFGARSSETKVLVVGCIHGNECAGKAIVRELRRVRSPRVRVVARMGLNPDGAEAGTRQNARGVDLNRNFRNGWRAIGEPWDTYHSGSGPLSEPESRAAVRLIKRHRPDVTIWYLQAMELVTRMKHHRRIQRHYAERVGLTLVRLDARPGTRRAGRTRSPPTHGVRRRASRGTARDASARRHARAVRAAALEWRQTREQARS